MPTRTSHVQLGSALTSGLWQVGQSEELMVIARMNEKSLSETGLMGLLSWLSSELHKIDLERTRGHLLHPAAPRQDQLGLNCS